MKLIDHLNQPSIPSRLQVQHLTSSSNGPIANSRDTSIRLSLRQLLKERLDMVACRSPKSSVLTSQEPNTRERNTHGRGSEVNAFVTIAARISGVVFVSSRVVVNRPRFRKSIRGIGVENVGIITIMAAERHSDHLIMIVKECNKVRSAKVLMSYIAERQ